ncbi:hypothetical protein Pst134EA_007822 [Puccinia striiformis f. sp. tritici]|nr:hypothetical protein Pst134EA_007822 [Puccinia striiformis f. sp. tritici]KAH9460726.1 hypothetical protein Pst134EB_008887 [Puccinia striiformis f. sp. tritici]KAH9470575.1 hypothetical protein Pst134EA_007822 [Puccinia striiformis f. sp. tritici]KAI9625128.1 hypothetical protein KEM48_008527 [Puccinia striiformis f. sp. tritici PST-130]KNE98936.1 glycosyl hydrolase family 10 [Puccinia striiformis f. sp. tritici PST-78]
MLVGVAVSANLLNSDQQYENIVKKNFALITAGNEMKWGPLEKAYGQIDFQEADQIYEYIKKNNKLLRIHTLFAQSQNPEWVKNLESQQVKSAMVNILDKVIQRYSERAIAIDVCNEILEDSGTLRNTVWVQKLTQTYVEFVYTTARQLATKYNKNLQLYLNDYGIEGIGPKSDAMLKLATDLNKKGILDAVGFQGHFIVGQVPKDLQTNLERFTNAGLKVAITELDVRIENIAQGITPEKQAQKANDYKFVFETCQKVGCVSVTVWGVTPKDSWVGKYGFFPGAGEALLFDSNYQPTPAMKELSQDLFQG